MDKINKLSLPATILVASIILGGFYYGSQVSKQNSIEKQQQIKIGQEKQEELSKELKEQQTKEDAEIALNSCLRVVLAVYKDALNTWGEYGKTCDTSYCLEGATKSMNEAKSEQEREEAQCYQRFPQN